MTATSTILDALTPLIADLAHELPPGLRYQRLLDTLRQLLPCDAVALLCLDGDQLVPLAIHGLSPDTLGRRFRITDHPRLQAILEAHGSQRFAADCALPDPYDGLIPSNTANLKVHDCMGCALRVGPQLWGILTVDALSAGRFSPSSQKTLETFASLAAATVAASRRFQTLSQNIEQERRHSEAWRLASQPGRLLAGQSPAFQQMMSEIALVAPSELTVLITGETGVGKELVARALHARSGRAERVMVCVNCAALPENLVESELFGHVRGAFSGALSDRNGKFAMANGGTLFLDEIGELPLAVQAKLLRVLQEGQLQRIGSDREHHTDIRLLAATNRNLAEEVRAGRFRADLYHRLSVFPLAVPPLRERQPDILLLAGAFIEENRRRMGLPGLRMTQEAQTALLSHPWPGNIRELEYLIARATLKASGRPHSSGIISIGICDLDMRPAPAAGERPPEITRPASLPPGTDLRSAVDRFQYQLIEHTLQNCQGNVAATARALGLDRANLARLAGRLGLVLPGRKKD